VSSLTAKPSPLPRRNHILISLLHFTDTNPTSFVDKNIIIDGQIIDCLDNKAARFFAKFIRCHCLFHFFICLRWLLHENWSQLPSHSVILAETEIVTNNAKT
jgi:hypothetical protein